jgi:protein-disulfide isomerase
MSNNYSLEVQKDSNGELFFEFPDALLNQMGWDAGDTLLWEELPGGSWKLELKKEESYEDLDNGTAR